MYSARVRTCVYIYMCVYIYIHTLNKYPITLTAINEIDKIIGAGFMSKVTSCAGRFSTKNK